MFDSVDPKQRLPELEEGILQYWREEDTFKRSIHRRGAAKDDMLDGHESGEGKVFSFYDGPPFATGLPHYGHLLAGTIKDVIPRYQTMRGHMVQRRFGWDCHGLPVENLIEKEHDITDKQQIEEMGIGAFNDLCRSAVLRHVHDWREVVERMGRWVDMDWDYKTMDPDYMESIWWMFSQLHKKDLIYEGHKPMHICPRCATPLSNFEVTQGYSDRTDMSVVMTFPLKDKEEMLPVNVEFRPPATEEEWNGLHEIRNREIFEAYHPDIQYDRNHPDDRADDKFPFVLIADGKVVGTIRIDILDAHSVALRLVAVDSTMQKKGYGNLLLRQGESVAKSFGRTRLLLHAEPTVLDFYKKNGFSETEEWEDIDIGDRIDLEKHISFTSLLAWTTTPWSLPGNMWLAMGNDIDYVKVKEGDMTYICAAKLVEKLFKDRDHEVIEHVKAKDFAGKKYEPLFPYFINVHLPSTEKAGKPETYGERVYKVVISDAVEVSDEEGTGIVHLTSATGEDSDAVAKEEGVDVFPHVAIDGNFIDLVTDFKGMNAKPEGDDPMATDKAVIAYLKEHGRHFDSFPITHSYPHCWRCDTPLLPYTTSSWFVSIDTIKNDMLKANSKTEWVPSHVRDGRFGKWLENARDWAISRNRYWGAPLPIWRTDDGNDTTVIGSRDELMQEKKIRFTKLTALRHAESEGNLIPIYQGVVPGTNLTKRGQKQASDVGAWLQTKNVDVIYCSPLARTQQTAQTIADATGATLIVDERLREVNFGEWEGKTVDFSDLTFVKERRAHKLEVGKPESIYHFDGMETWDSVQERIGSFLDEILPKHRSEHVVVVTHADPMVNIEQYMTKEDPVKLSHRPYPEKAVPKTYFWDHQKNQQIDLHKDTVDDITWPGSQTEKSVEVTLVRHGETDWNKEQKLQGGNADNPLNETGKKQAQDLASNLKGESYDCIVTTGLKRAQETADILSVELGIPVTDKLPELNERDLGGWSGMTFEEFEPQHPRAFEEMNPALHHEAPEDGESLDVFFERIDRACDIILERYAGKRILLVSHRGTMEALDALLHNVSHKEACANKVGNTETRDTVITPRLKRIPEVLDCWFESGSMPYAQEHFPFEMRHDGAKEPPAFPANFIAEGMDQTRGWFYTLTVLGAALFGKSPFEHCVVNGIVLAEDGKKMSKRLKNYPEPLEVVNKHGADAVRFTLMSSPAVRGEDLRFSERLVEENVRNVLLPLWNTYSFFVTYANAADFEPVNTRRASEHPLDIWIRAEVQDLVNRMTKELDAYDLSATCNELHETIDAITNWYVRLSRRRFAGKGVLDAYPDGTGDAENADQLDALHTLYDVLLTLSQLLAPFCPYITDAIFLNLVAEDHVSVHLTDWPEQRDLSKEETALLEKTRIMRGIVSLGNSIRASAKVKVRQPLQKATIALPPSVSVNMTQDDLDLLRQELNVKDVSFAEDPDELAESYVQVDARKVGPRLGKRVQEIIQAGKDGEFSIQPDGKILILDEWLAPDEAAVVYRGKEGEDAAADKGVVVSLDTTVTEALQLEGDARDIIRGVQRVRKESGLQFTDAIILQILDADDVLAEHKALIESETRSSIGDVDGNEYEIDVGERKVKIWFEKQ